MGRPSVGLRCPVVPPGQPLRAWGRKGPPQITVIQPEIRNLRITRTNLHWTAAPTPLRPYCSHRCQRSVRGAGSQGVLAADGRIALWDPAPRTDLRSTT